ncbi:dephospho-CoA kinase [Bacteroides sp.]|uniref:dephospho-CoA kinase n=1 Tax=Bacteroides sp. TaxID=29523 RepID=UPI00262B5108|nr:dephospho-CoA kinase [Bacteroides sp.]MDD3037362.1 dephospho-CoA kinase [Bacteroides sp.]
MAIKIGITGGIGSGKSVVSRLLEVMGIPVYISDVEAKRITLTDEVVRRRLSVLVGEDIYQNGELNRTLLASYMFGNPEHIKNVNGIIHPQVKEDFRRWSRCFSTDKIIGMESAILVEAGFKSEVDFLIMVYAPLEMRIERAIKRDCSSKELIMKRIQAQMSDELKREQADFLILNDGEMPLIPQVLELISLLSKNNHYLCSAKNN